MATVQLTLSQQAALSHDRHILITAGAGTGKTEVLIRRYLMLLTEPEVQHINQILALTFTEKAAGEMKHRVYRALLTQVRDHSTSTELRAKLRMFQDQFLSNHISTIDAFFASVIRRFPHRIAGLDPEFAILEGYRQRQLLQEAVESVLDGAATQPEHACHEDLRELLIGRRKTELLQILRQMVTRRHFIKPWLSWIADASDTDVLQAWQSLVQQDLDTALTGVEAQVGDLVGELQGFQAGGSGKDAAVKTRQGILDGLSGEPASLVDTLFTKAGKPRSFNQGSQKVWGDQKPLINACFAEIAARTQPFYQALCIPWNDELESEALQDLRALAHLTQYAIDAYQERKLSQGAVDFADLQIYTEQILTDPSTHQLYQRQFRYIMLDEFQDTNLAQWTQILRLAEDPSEPGSLFPDKLFVVGDEKQAIYRFRGGEVEVCDEAQHLIPGENRRNKRVGNYPRVSETPEADPDGMLSFDVNFRSKPNLLYFFNEFFAPLLVKHAAYEAEAQPLRYQDGSLPSMAVPAQGNVEAFRFEVWGEDAQQIALDVLEARCIAARLRAILDGEHETRYPGLRDMLLQRERAVGFLFRRRTRQKVYEQALREYGVPYVVARGRGFFSRQEILDISSALTILTYPHQSIPLVALLRSPYFAVSDVALVHLSRADGSTFREKLESLSLDKLSSDDARAVTKTREFLYDWSERMPDMRPSELILHLVHSSGVLAPLSRGSDGPQRVSNVYKLVDIARSFEQEGPSTLVDFVEFLSVQISEEEDEGEADLPEGGGVQIMTVHQAKGLEFPLVVLPDTVFPFRDDSGVLLGRLGRNVQVGWICARDDADAEKTAIHRLLHARNHSAMVAEEKRLLYVALTRAREHLWLTIREPKEDKEPTDLGTARTWNEWIWLRLRDPRLGWVSPLSLETPPAPDVAGATIPVEFDPNVVLPPESDAIGKC